MVATLRVVLDQAASGAGADLAAASVELARALVRTAPQGCEVDGLVPSGDAEAVRTAIGGLAGVDQAPLARRELAASWQLGIVTGIGGGMIHSPTLLAPLVRHDRAHDHDQTVVTLWDLTAWTDPGALPRASVVWQKAMLKRAVRHADAVVVPTHAMGEWLQERTKLGGRIRVIPGAAPTGFGVPVDEVGRRRGLGVPDGFVLVPGAALASLRAAFAALARSGADLPIVVTDVPAESAPAVVQLAADAGIDSIRVHVVGAVDVGDRGALLGGAVALVAPSTRRAFPWRVVEALAAGVPVVAAASDVHREVIFEGGIVAGSGAAPEVGGADAAALADAVAQALGSAAAIERLGVLAADRGRAFTWTGAAERVWQLHAEL